MSPIFSLLSSSVLTLFYRFALLPFLVSLSFVSPPYWFEHSTEGHCYQCYIHSPISGSGCALCMCETGVLLVCVCICVRDCVYVCVCVWHIPPRPPRCCGVWSCAWTLLWAGSTLSVEGMSLTVLPFHPFLHACVVLACL